MVNGGSERARTWDRIERAASNYTAKHLDHCRRCGVQFGASRLRRGASGPWFCSQACLNDDEQQTGGGRDDHAE